MIISSRDCADGILRSVKCQDFMYALQKKKYSALEPPSGANKVPKLPFLIYIL
jgi:hypothetical protein